MTLTRCVRAVTNDLATIANGVSHTRTTQRTQVNHGAVLPEDSMGLAHLLSTKDINLEFLYINLGIPESSDAAQKVVEKFTTERTLKLNIIKPQ